MTITNTPELRERVVEALRSHGLSPLDVLPMFHVKSWRNPIKQAFFDEVFIEGGEMPADLDAASKVVCEALRQIQLELLTAYDGEDVLPGDEA